MLPPVYIWKCCHWIWMTFYRTWDKIWTQGLLQVSSIKLFSKLPAALQPRPQAAQLFLQASDSVPKLTIVTVWSYQTSSSVRVTRLGMSMTFTWYTCATIQNVVNSSPANITTLEHISHTIALFYDRKFKLFSDMVSSTWLRQTEEKKHTKKTLLWKYKVYIAVCTMSIFSWVKNTGKQLLCKGYFISVIYSIQDYLGCIDTSWFNEMGNMQNPEKTMWPTTSIA